MILRVDEILQTLDIPIRYIIRPDIEKNQIGISYHFFNEGYNLYADGKGKEMGGSLLIDVFSTVDYSNIVKSAREKLEEAGFRFADSWDSDDSISGMKYYHKIMIFNYIEREVLYGRTGNN